jgi:hypothetical protein
MSEAQWEAAVRLASGKRMLTQCLFDFRYGGDRPAALDLLPGQHRRSGTGAAAAGPAAGASGSRQAGPTQQMAGNGAAASSGGQAPDVVTALFDLLTVAGVDVKVEEEEEEASTLGDQDLGQLRQEASEEGDGPESDEERRATREAAAGDVLTVEAPAAAKPAGQEPEPLGIHASLPPPPPKPAAASAAEASRRAALAASVEAALSAVREVPGAPLVSASLTGAAEQDRIARAAEGGTGGQQQRLREPLLPVGGGFSGAAVPAEVQAEIQRALPSRGTLGERHGAAGTATEQRRESPIVEVCELGGLQQRRPPSAHTAPCFSHIQLLHPPTSHPTNASPPTPYTPQTALLLAEAVQHGLRTIAFCKTRKLCEMVAKYARDTLRLTAPALADTVRVYRGGYTPAERREVEGALHGGALWGVAATNALELGIDVGGLDATLHLVGGGDCSGG